MNKYLKQFKQLLLLTVIALSISSCSAERTREEKVSAIISKMDSPFLIVSVTPQNLMDKSGILDGVLPFTYEMILGFFIDEKVTGIDYSVKSQVVLSKGEGFEPSFYGIFKVKDENKFIDLIKKEANADIVEKEGLKTAVKTKDGYAVAWNEEFAVIGNIPIDFSALFTGGGNNGDKTVNKLIGLIKAAKDGEVNSTYSNFLNKDNDIAMYFDGKGFYQYMKGMLLENATELERMRETYEGICAEFYFDFKPGSIDFEYVGDISDDLRKKFDFFKEKGVEGKLLSYANSNSPILVGGYNMDFTKFFDYYESLLTPEEFEKTTASIQEIGLTLDQFKNSMSGEFVYFIDRLTTVSQTVDFGYGEPYTYNSTIPMFAFVLGINNVDLVGSVLPDSLKLKNGSYKIGDAFIVLDGNVLFASNDELWADKVLKKETSSITKGKDVIAKDPFSWFVDFSAMSKSDGLNDAEPFVKLFSDFSGGFRIDKGYFKLLLYDASKNSLRIIMERVSEVMTKLDKESNSSMEAELEDAVLKGLEELEADLEQNATK